jgi:AAA family ATP:ADP antiporter
MCITLIVIAYNVSYQLIEILWTSKLHQAYPDPTQMSACISQVISLTGVFSILFALFVCKQVIQRFGWTVTALITPFVWLVAGLAFFLGILFKENFIYQLLISSLNLTSLSFIVLLGIIQISLGKASKYTFFDQTKEMSFIPLSLDRQRAGKIWIEGIVIWIGKFGGDFIYQLLLALHSEEDLALSILCIFLILVLVWIISVRILGAKMAP